jgi:hypothetical protein
MRPAVRKLSAFAAHAPIFQSTRLRMSGLILAALGISVHALPQTAAADPEFSLAIRRCCCGACYLQSSPHSIEIIDFTGCNSDTVASARSEPDTLYCRFNSGNGCGEAIASFLLRDVIVSGPAAGSVPLSINLHVDGDLAPGAANDASMSFAVSVNYATPYLSSLTVGSSGNVGSSGLFAGISGSSIHGDFVSPTFNVPVNSPIGLEISLDAGATGGQGSADFFSGSGLVHDQPLFNVPAGYTVNSSSGLIVNNSFVPGCPGRKGDFDSDNAVTSADIPDFVNNLLLGPADATVACKTDMNLDTLADASDVAPFILCLTGGPCP